MRNKKLINRVASVVMSGVLAFNFVAPSIQATKDQKSPFEQISAYERERMKRKKKNI